MVKLEKFFRNDERGFVLVEFVIALPLLILLLYCIGITSSKLLETAQKQAADYVLESEMNNVLGRIRDDARAAESVIITPTPRDNLDEITFVYHATNADLFGNGEYYGVLDDLLETRQYTTNNPRVKDIFYIYSHRLSQMERNPITGGNFFGDTTVKEFKFSQPSEKILHITFEMQNVKTKQSLRVCTSVYMPAYGE